MTINPNVKGAKSESFDKSHLSKSVDVPAGCTSSRFYIDSISQIKLHNSGKTPIRLNYFILFFSFGILYVFVFNTKNQLQFITIDQLKL